MGMFDGISDALVGGALGGVLGLVGQNQTNQKNWDIADAANRNNMQMQKDAQEYNADQARIDREFQASQVTGQQSYNSLEAQKNRDYQTQMSNTAYTRAVSDMKNAGLNPMLTVTQGGASSPSGATASGAAASGAHGSISPNRAVNPPQMGNSMAAAMNSASLFADVANKLEQNELLKAQIHNTDTQSDYTRARYYNELDLNPGIKKQVDKMMAEIGLMNQQARYSSASTAKTYQDIAIGAPDADKAGTAWGTIAPYAKDISSVIQAIKGFKIR